MENAKKLVMDIVNQIFILDGETEKKYHDELQIAIDQFQIIINDMHDENELKQSYEYDVVLAQSKALKD